MKDLRGFLICLFLVLLTLPVFGAPKKTKKKTKRKPAQATRPASSEIMRASADLEASLEKAESFELPNTTTISLRDTINLAIKNNPNIRSANLSCEAASNTYWASHYNYYFPSLNMNAENQHIMFKDNLLLSDSNTVNDTATVSVQGTVPYLGLNYIVTPASVTRTRTPGAGEQFQSQSSVSLELPLLKEFGPVMRSIIIEQADLDLQTSRYSCNSVVLKTVNEIRMAYWDLLFSNRALNIQQETLKGAAELVKETRTKIKNGLLPEMEISNSLANYYSRQAELLRVEQDVIGSQQRFKQLLGVSTTSNTRWYLASEDEMNRELTKPDTDLDVALKTALDTRPDYLSLVKSVESAYLTKKRAGNSRLPDLVAYGTAVAVNQRAQEEVTMGVRLSFSLPNVEGAAAYKNAVVDVTSKEIQLRQLREAIHEEVLTTVNQLKQSYQRIRSAKLAAKLSQQKLNAEIVKFQIGQLPQKNVVDSQRDLAAAQLAELEAYTAYRKAIVRLDNAMGVVKYR